MKRWEQSLVFVGVGLLVLVQIYTGISLDFSPQDHDDAPLHGLPSNSSQRLSPSSSFGACLMVKEDNDLLYEWIAYHYTVLPLRYLVIGSDVGNTQDPLDVLARWNATDLSYWVFNGKDFGQHHGVRQKDPKDTQGPHHEFLHRQRGFITACSVFLKQQNSTWVTYIDSDEFIVPNHFGKEEQETRREPKEPGSNRSIRFQMREALPAAKSGATVLDAIHRAAQVREFDRCYSMPRLLFGALENASCPKANTVDDLARKEFSFSQMSTLRFKQHARKGDFKTGRFGKVFVDLSRLSMHEIAGKVPKNIHRPFQPACGKPVVVFDESVFYVNHYVGSWERYNSRIDERRSCSEWMSRAYLQDSVSCEQEIHEWFPSFIRLVGSLGTAKFLLGVDNRNASSKVSREECPPMTLS